MNSPTRLTSVRLLSSGLLLASAGVTLQAAVLFNDTFDSSGATRNNDSADAADLQWWQVPSSSSMSTTVPTTMDAVIGTGRSMKGADLSTSMPGYQQVVGKFASATLGTSVGDQLILSCDVGNQGGTEVSGNRFVLGLYSSNGTDMTADATGNSSDDKGYGVDVPFSSYSSVGARSFKEAGNNSGLTSGTDVTTLATGAAMTWRTNGGKRRLTITLTRQSGGVQVATKVESGATIVSSTSYTDTSSPLTSFNEAVVSTSSPGGTTLSFSVDNVTLNQVSSTQVVRYFASTSFWNRGVTTEAVATDQSDVQKVVNQVAQYGTYFNTWQYSTPVWIADANEPTITVTDSDDGFMTSRWGPVPWPSEASAAAGTDQHCVVFQPSTNKMWEFWKAAGTYPNITARHGAVLSNVTTTSTGISPSPYGATATGLAMIGGTVLLTEADELNANANYNIRHALALDLVQVDPGAHLAPATRHDGFSGTNMVKEGRRFRLPPNYNPEVSIPNAPPLTKALARAARDYGIVVRDKSGSVTFFGEDAKTRSTNPWTSTLYGGKPGYDVLDSFPWASLQVLNPTTN